MPDDTTFYDRLGIPQDASHEQIRTAFREAARRLHPDVNVEAGATEIFLNVKEAYEVLSDPNERAVYDGKLAQKPQPPLPVRLRTLFSRQALARMREKQLVYALLDLEVLNQVISSQKLSHPPLNLALVLDCSTSMQGQRLDRVKAAAIELVKKLRVQDTLAIISFNDRAEIIVPAGLRLDATRAESRIRMLQTSGGTEIFQGLKAGFVEVQRFLDKAHSNHIVLVTDGHTYGDERACLDLANQAASLGIGISGLGLGSEWNDAFLDELTGITGGSSMYITSAIDIHQWLHKRVKGLGNSCVQRVTLQLQEIPGAELRDAFRLTPDASDLPHQPHLLLGDIPCNEKLQIILEFLIEPISPAVNRIILAEGGITFDIPGYSESSFRIPITLVLDVLDQPPIETPPEEILEAMSRLTLYRIQERARQEVSAGKIESAARSLQYLATHLLARGKNELAKTVIVETQHLQQQQQYSQNGEKQIKYGTRALILPNRQEE